MRVQALAVSILILLASGPRAEPTVSTADLLEKAVFTEETVGDLQGAITLYEQIVAEAEANRAHLAQARYRLGMCHLKLGHDRQAIAAFQGLIEQFPEQQALVATARERLEELGRSPNLVSRQAWAKPIDDMGAPSPDGRRLSFVDWSDGNLAVYEFATGEHHSVTRAGNWGEASEWAEHSVWSPDGGQLAYIWYTPDWRAKGVELRLIDADGTDRRTLYRNENVEYPRPIAFTRDGKEILTILHENGGSHQVAFIAVADGSARVIKRAPADWDHGRVSLSPDGRFIAFGDGDIYVMSADGSGEHPVVEHPARDGGAMWTPDGAALVFLSGRAGSRGLWIVDMQDGAPRGAPRLVKNDLGQATPIGFTAAGSFYYSVVTPSADVWVAAVDWKNGKLASPARKLVESFEGFNARPAWSPDGKSLIYHSRREGSRTGGGVLVVRSATDGQERTLSPAIQGMLAGNSAPAWSPDGSSVFVWAAGPDSSHSKIYQVDARSGDVLRAVEDEAPIRPRTPAVSTDGQTLYYLTQGPSEEKQRIVARQLDSGRSKVLHEGFVAAIGLSHGGRQLAFVEHVEAPDGKTLRVAVIDASGGQPRTLTELDRLRWGVAWTPDDRELLVVKRVDRKDVSRPGDLWAIAVDGGASRDLGIPVDGLTQLSVRGDGRLVYSLEGSDMEIWTVENFLPAQRASR